MPESFEVVAARLEETMKAVTTGMDEVKASVGQLTESVKEVTAVAQKASYEAKSSQESMATMWSRIDAQKETVESLVAFTEQIRGAGKAVLIVLSMTQGILIMLLVWLFSSVAAIREQKAVVEYRLLQIEKVQGAEHAKD